MRDISLQQTSRSSCISTKVIDRFSCSRIAWDDTGGAAKLPDEIEMDRAEAKELREIRLLNSGAKGRLYDRSPVEGLSHGDGSFHRGSPRFDDVGHGLRQRRIMSSAEDPHGWRTRNS
jgi:hypothetical protein